MRTRPDQKPPIDIDEVVQQNEQLKLKLQDAEQTLDTLMQQEVEKEDGLVTRSFRDRPQLFLISPVWILGTRMFLLWFVEDFGTKAWIEGIIADVLLGAGTLWMLAEWVHYEWKVNEYLIVPRGVLVLVGLLVPADVFTGGGVWHGTMHRVTPKASLIAFAVATGALLIAASSYCPNALDKTQAFLDHPVKTVKKLMKGIYDKERND